MAEKHQQLFNTSYLRSIWADDYEEFRGSDEARELLSRLQNWTVKEWQKETASEGEFIYQFFKKTWGYTASGGGNKDEGYTLEQQFQVQSAGQKGGAGFADIALGRFGRDDMSPIPQVLGEFKDDRSGLDKPQAGRPNSRTPVEQCLDYLREARTGLISPILPAWGLVTDMNEFRLYYYGDKSRYQRFVIKPAEGDLAISLLDESEEASFQRFLFYRMFHSDWLLTGAGKSHLEKVLAEQIVHEESLENEFYKEYQAFRESIYQALRKFNPEYEQKRRLRQLVKFTQRILDRCLFILYCEDMGRELNFPPNVLRDLLIDVADNKYYDPEGEEAWCYVNRLFGAMRDGSPFGDERINKFNGGLFAFDPEMEALRLPNRIFCRKAQGQTSERLLKYPETLLYFSAKYNFGASDDGSGRTLTLTAMGRIFEQSITDLEVMEAHAENRESLSELTKRKRDGVYYTPEWVTHYIVEETVGARLAEIRKELGFDRFADVSEEQIEDYRRDKRKAKIVGDYEEALYKYRDRLDNLKVVDPACGSGAFLIQAFRHLYEQSRWIAQKLEKVTGEAGLFDTHMAMSSVLSKNLYGVDINAESVEITRLALWLHTALPDQPLTSLDKNIRCGNSLIGSDFYDQINIERDMFDEEEVERVNTFDWKKAFPEVFNQENPGFDCVIGNPPYVKLQHFRKVQEDVAKYLVEAKRPDGGPMYESAQTGNFDLYLPFIEKGVELLNEKGKMGYIAPNVWMVNEYGKGLRKKLKRTRRLDRWIDFKSYQVFDEAITYTALQFFSGSLQDKIRCVFAPEGKEVLPSIKWNEVEDFVSYEELPENDGWVFLPKTEYRLLKKLSNNFGELGDKNVTKKIFQGMVTSANCVYHLHKSHKDLFQKFKKQKIKIQEIEDKYLRPLVTGPDAKRYQMPNIGTYLIFPYDVTEKKSTLAPIDKIKNEAPQTYQLLKNHEVLLRNREYPKMDKDDKWWGYVYPKNQVEQAKPKIMIASTATEIRAFADPRGQFAPDDRRIYSVVPVNYDDLHYLLGLLNSSLHTFLLKKWARPKANGYYDIETQFLSPLPIPKATEDQKTEVSQKARKLQELHTRRRDLLLMINKRLDSSQCEDDKRKEGWLWADVKSVSEFKKDAPEELKGKEKTKWAKTERQSKLDHHLEAIDAMLTPGVQLSVENEYGELKILANGVSLIDGIFVDQEEASFIAAQWRHKARRTNVTEKFDAKRLVNLFLKLRKTSNKAIKDQVVKLDQDVRDLDKEIEKAEKEMNELTYELYGLTEEEIKLVEEDFSVF